MNTRIQSLVIMLAVFVGVNRVPAQGTMFTYQGQLLDGGQPANGTNYGMMFYLYNAPTSGSPLGNLGIVSVTVSNGLFTVPLDFGSQFDGTPRWLEVSVQKNGGTFTTLTPRQQLTSTPYAIMANNASNLLGTLPVAQLSGSLGLTQLPAEVVTNNSSGLTLSGTFSGDGSGLLNTVTAANYVSAWDFSNHSVSSPNSFQGVSFAYTSLSSGWIYYGNGSTTFTCQQNGLYLIRYDAEVDTTVSSATTITLRAVNETSALEIQGSEAAVTLAAANQNIPVSKSFLAFIYTGNQLQIQFASSNTSGQLVSGLSTATYQPSISLTIVRIQ